MSAEMRVKNLIKLQARAISAEEVARWGQRAKFHFDKLVADGYAQTVADDFDPTICGYEITPKGEAYLADRYKK